MRTTTLFLRDGGTFSQISQVGVSFFLGGLILPVNPQELNISNSGKNTVVEVVKIGDVNILKRKKLEEISFDFLLPESPHYPFVKSWNPPSVYQNTFKNLMDSGSPTTFMAMGLGYSQYVSIEELGEKIIGGDHDSVRMSIKLKEYKPYSAGVLSTPNNPQPPTAGGEERVEQDSGNTSHTVQSGDTLWDIAKEYYGDGGRYEEIAQANNITNPNLIHPGQNLVIP